MVRAEFLDADVSGFVGRLGEKRRLGLNFDPRLRERSDLLCSGGGGVL